MMEEKKKIVVFEDEQICLEMDYKFAKDHESYLVIVQVIFLRYSIRQL